MSLEELEIEVLSLDPAARARLAHRLLVSLDELSEAEHAAVWAEEAAQRATAWEWGGEGAAVFRAARARLAE